MKQTNQMLWFILGSGFLAMIMSTIFSFLIMMRNDKIHQKVKYLYQKEVGK